MEELQLSDALQRYFSDIFLCCDEENSGKASATKALELIKSGNVPDDVAAQVNLTSRQHQIKQMKKQCPPLFYMHTDIRDLLEPELRPLK